MQQTQNELLTIREAWRRSDRLQRAHVHLATVRRWALKGLRGIKLKLVVVGDVWRIAEGELESFLDRVERAKLDRTRPRLATSTDRPNDRRQRESLRAAKQLDAMRRNNA